MKKIWQSLKNLTLSLTGKWTLTSSIFIFLVFTFFATFTYQTASTVILHKEKQNLEKTVDLVVSHLEENSQNLDYETVMKSLTKKDTNKSATTLVQPDPLITDIFQPDLSLFIYNQQEKLVFQSQAEKEVLLSHDAIKNEVTTLHQQKKLLYVYPLKSKQTNKLIGYLQSYSDLSNYFSMKEKLKTTLLLLVFISFIVSLILGYLLASYFLRPLGTLRDTMEKIRKTPQLNIEMPTLNTKDELDDLAAIFNEMMSQMRLYVEQQEQFVQDVSHELRTPVAVMEGHLKLLQRWGKDDPQVLAESLEASLQEVTRMKALVQEMLQLAQLKNIPATADCPSGKIQEVVEQVLQSFRLIHENFEFQLETINSEKVKVTMPAHHLEQLLIIFLDNAIKYSGESKVVKVSLATVEENIYLKIIDYGVGMSPEETEKIFNRFYRVDKARSKSIGGNGLGLTIAKKLMDQYQGKILVESHLKEGTIFTLVLKKDTKEREI